MYDQIDSQMDKKNATKENKLVGRFFIFYFFSNSCFETGHSIVDFQEHNIFPLSCPTVSSFLEILLMLQDLDRRRRKRSNLTLHHRWHRGTQSPRARLRHLHRRSPSDRDGRPGHRVQRHRHGVGRHGCQNGDGLRATTSFALVDFIQISTQSIPGNPGRRDDRCRGQR